MSPQTPTGSNAYQVNVNRTKTKKWVEAKVQSYDGDDWGADEYEDETSEEEAPPPLPKSTTHASGSRESTLPSLQTQQPSTRSAPITQTSNVTSTTPGAPGPSSATASPVETHTVTPKTGGATHGFSGPASHQEPGNSTPTLEPTTADQGSAPSFVRPSDIYNRMEEEKDKERKSLDSAGVRPDSMGKDEAFNVGGKTKTPTADVDEAGRRASISPKLPDFARMSAFGTDLFSTGNAGQSKAEPITEKDGETEVLSSPPMPQAQAPLSTSVTEDAPVPEEAPFVQAPTEEDQDRKSMTSEHDKDESRPITVSAADDSISREDDAETETKKDAPPSGTNDLPTLSKENIPVLQPDSDMHDIAPLRTPSPRGPARTDLDSPQARFDAVEATETANVKPADHRPEVNFEPKPFQRETTFSTVTSSPVKDNDMLSDEILKSLSPVGPSAHEFSPAATGNDSQISNRNAARDSSYTLKDYDSYWDDAEDKIKSLETSAPITTIPEVPESQSKPMSQSTISPADKPTESLVSPQSSTLRRRFSWEAEEVSPAPAQQEPPYVSPTTQTQGPVAEPAAFGAKSEGPSKPSTDEPRSASGVSPQISNGSSGHPGHGPQTAFEAPSPLSPSGGNTTGVRSDHQLSLVEDRAVEQPTLSIMSNATTSDEQPALAIQTSPPASPSPTVPISQQAQQQIMSFREIMSLNNSSERIAKYNETRKVFSSTDSGLDAWLVHLRGQHPDMSTSGLEFGGQAAQETSQDSSVAASSGAPSAPAQQPYYQQYLNASSPTAASSPTNRTRIGGLPIPMQASGSTFGHSGNQIGTKSKELMHSAGKMGKGLLSKGRSKLRGTGDKDESLSTSGTDQAKSSTSKTDRRSSWGLSLGSKSRNLTLTDEVDPQRKAKAHAASSSTSMSTTNANANPNSNSNSSSSLGNANLHSLHMHRVAPDATSSSMPPQLPQIPHAAPLSPLNPATHPEYIPEWRSIAVDSDLDSSTAQPVVTLRHPVPPVQAQPSHPSRATAGLSKLEIPNSGSLISNGATTAPVLSMQNTHQGQPTGYEARGLNTATTERVGQQWAMMSQGQPHQHQHQQPRPHPSQLHPSHAVPIIDQRRNGPPPPRPVLQDSGIGLTAPAESEQEPKRSSSFIGLPPIRRSSTFGLTPKSKTRKATDRFPLDDDGDDEPSDRASLADAPVDVEPEHLQSQQQLASSHAPQVTAKRPSDNVAALSQSIKDEKAGIVVSHSEVPPESPFREGPGRHSQNHPQHEQQTTLANQQQPPVRGQIPPAQNAQDSQQWVHPTRRVPFAGQWKLEESRLSEPLNAVSRNRSGTAGSQQQIMYGFDKETGMSAEEFTTSNPAQDPTHQLKQQQPPQQPLQQTVPNPMSPPPLRQRSDVPPSSAQRWPELFAHPPDQRPRSNPRNGGQPYQPPYQTSLARNEFAMPRPPTNEFAIAGVGPPEEDRGRRNRNSGLFEKFGHRIARATSRERRGSMDQRPAASDVRGDEASESSVGTGPDIPEQGKRRSSFLFGRSGRASMDTGPRHNVGTGHEQSSQEPLPPSTPPPGDRRRSLLSGGIGAKLVPSKLSKSSSSNLDHDQNVAQVSQPPPDVHETTPQKKRFSGMSKVSNLLSRNKHEDKQSASQPQPQPQPTVEPLEPPAPPFKHLGRVSTDSSVGSSNDRRDESPDRRGRRPSMSGLITGMLGKRSASKTREQDPRMDSQTSFQHQMNAQPQSVADAKEQNMWQGDQHQRQYPHGPDQITGRLPPGDPSQRQPTPLRDQVNVHHPPAGNLHQQRLSQTEQFQRHHSPAPNQAPPPQPQVMGGGPTKGVPGANLYQRQHSPVTHGPPASPPTQQFSSQHPIGYMGQRDGIRSPPNIDVSTRYARPPQPSPLGLVPRTAGHQAEPDAAPAKQDERQVGQPSGQEEEQRGMSPVPSKSPEKPRASLTEPQAQSDHDVQNSVPVEGEILRTSTVSPDLSITSDWKAIEHNPDEGVSDARRDGSMDLSDERNFTVVKAGNTQAAGDLSRPNEATSPRQDSDPLPTAPVVQQAGKQAPGNLPQMQTAREQMTPSGDFRKPQSPHIPATEQGQFPGQDMRQGVQREQPVKLGNLVPQPAQNPGQQPAQQSRLQYPQHPQHVHQIQQIPSGPQRLQYPQQQQQHMQHMQSYPGMPIHSNGPVGPATQFSGMGQQQAPHQDPRFSHPQTLQPQVTQKESTGSRWKGLTKRMSEQMSHIGHQNPTETKPEKAEKSTGNKLLGAFKRNSKQPEAQNTAPIHMAATNHPSGQWQHMQHPQQPPYQTNPNQQAFGHSQQQPGHPQPVNQNTSNIPMPPRQVHSSVGPAQMTGQQGHQVAPHESVQQQPMQPVQPEPEPRYDFVPIPRGYTAVHGEGMTAPTAYNVGRGPQTHSQPVQMQMQPQYRQQSPRMPQQQQQQPPPQASPPASQSSFPRQDSVSSFGIVQSPSVPSLDEQRTSSRLDNAISQPTSNASPAPIKEPQPVSLVQGPEPGLPQTKQSNGHLAQPNIDSSIAGRSVSDVESHSQQSKSPAPQAESPPQIKAAPRTEDHTATRSANSNNLGVDVAKAKQHHDDDIYDATPRLNKDDPGEGAKAPEMERQVSEDSLKEKTKKEGPKTKSEFTAELEDTAGAHERRVRLASQEEKIWIDPEDDPNYQPQMSATSYPGQEWNPYGDPDFLDE